MRRVLTLPVGGIDPQAVLASLQTGELQHVRTPLDQALFTLAWSAWKGVPVDEQERSVLRALVDALPAAPLDAVPVTVEVAPCP